MSGIVIADDYLDPDVTYLLGLIVARGTILEDRQLYRLVAVSRLGNLRYTPRIYPYIEAARIARLSSGSATSISAKTRSNSRPPGTISMRSGRPPNKMVKA